MGSHSSTTRGPLLCATFAIAVVLLFPKAALVGTGPAWAGPLDERKGHDPGLLSWPPNLQSPWATGDWRGRRTWLQGRGLALHCEYYGEAFWNLYGGIETSDGGAYEGLFDLWLAVSTDRAGLWRGGLLFFLLQQKHGKGITLDEVGDFQVLSNMDAHGFTQVSELWYRHAFLDGRVWVKVGKQDANQDFAGVEYGGEFINSSAGFAPTIPLASYPDQDLGIVLGMVPARWFSLNLGAYNGDPHGNRGFKGAFVHLSGPMILAEPAFHYRLGRSRGHIRAGGWFNGTDVPSPDDNDAHPKTHSRAYGWYLTWDQELWSECPEKAGPGQGIGMFAQYGWAPPDRSAAEHYVGGGIRWAGMLAGRDEDIAGLGVFHVRFSGEARTARDSETAVEAFYLVQLLGCLFVQPDLQCIIHPGGAARPHALAVGLRWGLSL